LILNKEVLKVQEKRLLAVRFNSGITLKIVKKSKTQSLLIALRAFSAVETLNSKSSIVAVKVAILAAH
jgi:hypothetical protein